MMAPIERPANETIQQLKCQDPTNWNGTIPRMKCRDSAFGTRVQLIRQFLRSKRDDGSRPPPPLGTYARFHTLIEPKIFPQQLSFPLKHPLDLDSWPDQQLVESRGNFPHDYLSTAFQQLVLVLRLL